MAPTQSLKVRTYSFFISWHLISFNTDHYQFQRLCFIYRKHWPLLIGSKDPDDVRQIGLAMVKYDHDFLGLLREWPGNHREEKLRSFLSNAKLFFEEGGVFWKFGEPWVKVNEVDDEVPQSNKPDVVTAQGNTTGRVEEPGSTSLPDTPSRSAITGMAKSDDSPMSLYPIGGDNNKLRKDCSGMGLQGEHRTVAREQELIQRMSLLLRLRRGVQW